MDEPSSAIPVRNAAAREVVRGELDLDLVTGEDSDVVLPHLSGDGRKHRVPVLQLDAEHRAGKRLRDLALELDLVLLLGHEPFWREFQGKAREKQTPRASGSS